MPLDLDADLVGMTVITGSAPRAYELAGALPRVAASRWCWAVRMSRCCLTRRSNTPTAICTGYAEEILAAAAARFRRKACCKPRYTQAAHLHLRGLPFARRELFDKHDYLTQAVFEATRSCAHDCEFCVAPTAWGRKQFQKPVEEVVADIRQFGARRLIFIDLNLISDTTTHASCSRGWCR